MALPLSWRILTITILKRLVLIAMSKLIKVCGHKIMLTGSRYYIT